MFAKRYKIQMTHKGTRYLFYCDLCNACCGGDALLQSGPEKAWRQARSHFNRCHRCGRWVCDNHYDESVMLCCPCAALQLREAQAAWGYRTSHCECCGATLQEKDLFCRVCGKPIAGKGA